MHAPHDWTTRQYIAYMLDALGLTRKAQAALTTATDAHLQIYVELIKLAARHNEQLAEFLEFSGLAFNGIALCS